MSLLGGELGGSTGAGESSDSPPDAETNVKLATSVAHNLVGTRVNAFRTLCLWTVAFVQTFNFYGLMLHSPLVFRRTAYDDLGRERKDVIAFDFLAIIIVNAGDIVGNGLALAALKAKANPRWVCAACACVCVPLLWVPLIDALRSSRTGLIFMMLIGRVPAAPIGAMSWILASVAYPTLFRATGHGLANAVARFGAGGGVVDVLHARVHRRAHPRDRARGDRARGAATAARELGERGGGWGGGGGQRRDDVCSTQERVLAARANYIVY